jgi:hypothetical protein
MAIAITDNKTVAVGAFKLPNRKKPCLCIERNGKLKVYGYFSNDKTADLFVQELADIFGVEEKNIQSSK